jgi:hypothetical protein
VRLRQGRIEALRRGFQRISPHLYEERPARAGFFALHLHLLGSQLLVVLDLQDFAVPMILVASRESGFLTNV